MKYINLSIILFSYKYMVLALFTSNTVVNSCCYSVLCGQVAGGAKLLPHKSPQKATIYIQPQRTQRVDFIFCTLRIKWSRDSSVSIVTCYRLDGPGSNPGGGEIFRTHPDQL